MRTPGAQMPDLSGATAVVTGANSGIGLPTARELASQGAHVVVASRDPQKARTAIDDIRRRVPDADLSFERLDLADLSSVHACADALRRRLDRLDLLINNAGIGLTRPGHTADGFELWFGTNHLGHFALTGLLLPLVLATPAARVVTVSSDAHQAGKIEFDNLGREPNYNRLAAYARSKLANLLFTRELQRRADAAGVDLLSVAAHPGTTATSIVRLGPLTRPFEAMLRVFLQSSDKGAIPTLHAAGARGVTGGDYIGPGPKKLRPSPRALDDTTARRLWDVSEELTGVRFDQLATRAGRE